MKIRRRTEITILTDKPVVAANASPVFAECVTCAGGVRMLTADEAALAARVNSRAIYRLVEAGRLHFQETSAGSLLVCPASLLIEAEKLLPEKTEN